MNTSLAAKRRKALWLIVGGATATGTASSLPTPVIEIPEQLAIGAADLALCAGIYQIYYDRPMDTASATALFAELGLVTAAGVGAGYTGVKLTEGILAEVLNWVPFIGWGLSAVITGSVTASVGCAFWYLCDVAVREGWALGRTSAPRSIGS